MLKGREMDIAIQGFCEDVAVGYKPDVVSYSAATSACQKAVECVLSFEL